MAQVRKMTFLEFSTNIGNIIKLHMKAFIT